MNLAILRKAPVGFPSPLRETYNAVADAVHRACTWHQQWASPVGSLDDFDGGAQAIANSMRDAEKEIVDAELWLQENAPGAHEACEDALEQVRFVAHACTHVRRRWDPEPDTKPCSSFPRCPPFLGNIRDYFEAWPAVDERTVLEQLRSRVIEAFARIEQRSMIHMNSDLLDALASLRNTIADPEAARGPETRDLVPAALVRKSGEKVLTLLCPLGVNKSRKPDFSGFDVSLPARVGLGELWQRLVSFLWDHVAARDTRDDWIVFLDDLMELLHTGRPANPGQQGCGAAPNGEAEEHEESSPDTVGDDRPPCHAPTDDARSVETDQVPPPQATAPQAIGLIRIPGPSGETLEFPIHELRGTAEAGQGQRFAVSGSIPKERLPELLAVGRSIGQAPAGNPMAPDATDAVQYVTLDKMSAIVNRGKRTLERCKKRKNNPLPAAAIEGGGGKPDEWIWSNVRPWLESEFNRPLPERYPALRQ